jgi:hypothetical protein
VDGPDDEIGKNRSGSADRQAAEERQCWSTGSVMNRRLVRDMVSASARRKPSTSSRPAGSAVTRHLDRQVGNRHFQNGPWCLFPASPSADSAVPLSCVSLVGGVAGRTCGASSKHDRSAAENSDLRHHASTLPTRAGGTPQIRLNRK